MKLEQVQVDPQAMEEGEWRPHPYFDGIEILVRSPESDAVAKRRTALLNREPQKRRKTGDVVEATRRIELLCTAECLIDVKGFDDVTYSQDVGRQWAKDPAMRRFMEGVREVADEIGQIEQMAHEDDVSD